uniref:hypothetical protein n=1 Tax=Bartonella sp. AP1QHHD TaxID=3243474 RepID=UPI0035D04F67
MKKLYATLAHDDANGTHFPYPLSLVRVLLLVAIVAFLSNVSPSFSANVDLSKMFLEGVESAVVGTPQNVISAYNSDNSDLDASSASKENYITALSVATTPKVDATSDYANFLINTLSGNSDKNSTIKTDNSSVINTLTARQLIPVSEMQRGGGKGVELGEAASAPSVSSIAIGNKQTYDCGKGKNCSYVAARASAERTIAIGLSSEAKNYQGIAIGVTAQAFADNTVAIGPSTKATEKNAIVLGYSSEATGLNSISIGRSAHSLGLHSIAIGSDDITDKYPDDYTTAKSNHSIAVGRVAKVRGENGIGIGQRSSVWDNANNGISIGYYSKAQALDSIGLGHDALGMVEGSVAIGSHTRANRAAGVSGYTSVLQGPATNEVSYWKSTSGAVSVGDVDAGKTRQITGVAAGSEDADAVNVIQLKDLERVVRQNGWKLSVDGKNAKTVIMDSGVDFSTGSTNLNITKGDKDNKVKFDLAKDVTLTSLKAGTTALDATGLVISGGPKITTDGIDAGGKEIKKVKAAALTETSQQAVNGSQLFATNNEIADVRDSILVKQEQEEENRLARSLRAGGTGLITIGKGTGGTEISILNKDNGKRKISGLLGGDLSANSDEAVNGSQLFTTNQNVTIVATNIAKYLGGGAKYESGAWTAPKFTVKSVKDDGETENKEYPDVASAFEGVGTSITNVQNKLTEQVNNVINKVESESFVQQDKTTHRLTIGAAVEGSEINIANKTGADRIISGVGEATKDNEAVNKGQLDKSLKDLSTSLQSDDSAVVHYDKKDGDNGGINYTSVTLGGKDKTAVGLHNVADGKIAKDSHDAITGGQVNTIASDLSKILGGAVSFDGKNFTGPTYDLSTVSKEGNVTNKSYEGVETAFKGLDENIKTVNDRIKEVSEGVSQDSLSWSNQSNAFVALHGKEGEKTNSKVTSLADGSLVAGSSDAVTGGQINTIAASLAKILGGKASFSADGTFTAPSYDLSTVSKEGDVTNKSYEGVGTAFSALDANIKNVNARIKEVSQGVAQDSLVWSKDANAFSAQHGEKEDKKNSKITSLENGKLSEESTDAVNGSQLHSTNTALAEYFGGNTKYEEGKWTEPDFKVAQFDSDGTEGDTKIYHNVAAAFEGVNSAFTTLNDEIVDVRDSILVKQEEETSFSRSLRAGGSGVITIGKAAGGTEVSILNNEGKERTLTGVSTGELSESSTDAVNGSQLFTTNKNVTKIAEHTAKYFGGGAGYDDAGEWTAPSFKVKKFDDTGNSKEETYNNVADALDGVSTSFTNIHKEINKVVSDSLVKQDNDTKLISIGSGKGGSAISIADNTSTDRTLSGVKAAENDNEAVNKGQLDKEIKGLAQTVKSDSLNWSEADKAFVAQHGEGDTKGNSKITSLQAGRVSKDSSEAVNGSQLYSLGDKVATYFGGGAKYESGEWTAPSFKIKTFNDDGTEKDKSYTDVASAFEGVGTSITNVKKELTKVVGDSLVKQDTDSKTIKIGAETDGATINIA